MYHEDYPPVVSNIIDTSRKDLYEGYYSVQGGFPEAQGVAEIDRLMLLQSYVDTVILRDIIERHDIRNVVALREMVRQQSVSAAFTVQCS